MKKNICCPICNGKLEKTNIKWNKYFYYRCNLCEHTVLDIPNSTNLKYQKDYMKTRIMVGDIKNGEFTDRYYENRQTILNRRIIKINHLIHSEDSVFDIGCGGGFTLRYYRDRGCKVKGIEIEPLGIDACKRLDIECIEDNFLTVNMEEKFDVVMAWHELERVLDINAFVEKVIDITNENGIIMIEVSTNMRPPQSYGLYNGNVHRFSKKSFEKFMNKFNLTLIRLTEGVQKQSWLYTGRINKDDLRKEKRNDS